jgi:hypothetical protein
MRRAILLAAFLAAVWCPASIASTAESWHTLRARSAGITLSVPATWIDFTQLTPQLIDRAKSVPALQAYIEAARNSKAIKLLAADVGPATVKSGFANNTNIVQTPAVGDLSFLRNAAVAQLEATGIVKGPIKTGFTTLPSGRALTLKYVLIVNGRLVATTQFVLIRAGVSTALTYSARPGSLAEATIRRSARSLRLG